MHLRIKLKKVFRNQNYPAPNTEKFTVFVIPSKPSSEQRRQTGRNHPQRGENPTETDTEVIQRRTEGLRTADGTVSRRFQKVTGAQAW